MRKLFLILLFAVFSLHVFSQDEGFGLGLILGEPTGLSAKIWTGEHTAIDAAMAWSFIDTGFLRVHADMLHHIFSIDVEKGQLPIYFGLGAKLVFSSNLELGVRLPVGISYLFESAPFDVFIEVVPGLNLIPATTFFIEGGLGARYFF